MKPHIVPTGHYEPVDPDLAGFFPVCTEAGTPIGMCVWYVNGTRYEMRLDLLSEYRVQYQKEFK